MQGVTEKWLHKEENQGDVLNTGVPLWLKSLTIRVTFLCGSMKQAFDIRFDIRFVAYPLFITVISVLKVL